MSREKLPSKPKSSPLIKIHIVRGENVGKLQFDNILSLIEQYSKKSSKLISFIPHELHPDFDIDELEERSIEKMEMVKQFDKDFDPKNKNEVNSIFEVCKDFRNVKKNKIQDKELMVLLTNQKNPNFMSFCNINITNVFIQINGWDQILESFKSDLPILYEIYAWIFRKIVFPDLPTMKMKLKRKTIGCITDFCENKEDFRMKIRTADIHPDAINYMSSKKEFFPHLKHILEVFEQIRLGVLNREKSEFFSELVSLRFALYFNAKRNIIIPEYGEISLGFEAIERAIYQLIIMQEYPISREIINDEIMYIYKLQSAYNKQKENIENTIENFLNDPDSFYQKVSKINKRLKDILPTQIVDYYLINIDYQENIKQYSIKLKHQLGRTDLIIFDNGYLE